MLLGGSGDVFVNVDYTDEQKFADGAAARARTGAKIVNSTYRKFYQEDEDVLFDTYRDEDPERAWGVAGWASRAGQAAYFDWAVANSLLPEETASPDRDWALSFTSATSRLEFGEVAFDVSAGYTIEFWAELHGTSDVFAVELEMDGLNPWTSRVELAELDKVSWTIDAAGTTLVSDTNLVAGWQQIALVAEPFGPTEMVYRIVFDGQEAGSMTNGADVYTGLQLNFEWGGGTVLTTDVARIDDVRVWSKALSTVEILATKDLHLVGNELGLISWYPIVAGTGLSVFDQAGVQNGFLLDGEWVLPTGTPRPPEPVVPDGAKFRGILAIDRNNVPSLVEIASQASFIQRQLDQADIGLNPLGLARDAIPFDIDPDAIDAGLTHFEQIWERARVALGNAKLLFDQAAGTTQRLRRQSVSNTSLAENLSKLEMGYRNQLIEIFGYPYSDDIGPLGAYPQGYDGPDLVHFSVVDFADLGLTTSANPLTGGVDTIDPTRAVEVEIPIMNYSFAWEAIQSNDFEKFTWEADDWEDWDFDLDRTTQVASVSFSLSEEGFVLKPDSWTGRRKAQGRLQFAYADYLKAYYALTSAAIDYLGALSGLETAFQKLENLRSTAQSEFGDLEDLVDAKNVTLGLGLAAELSENLYSIFEKVTDTGADTIESLVPEVSTGTAGLGPLFEVKTKPGQAAAAAWELPQAAAFVAVQALKFSQIGAQFNEDLLTVDLESTLAENQYRADIQWAARDLNDSLCDQFFKLEDMNQKLVDFQQKEEGFRGLVAEGERVLQERLQERSKAARHVQTQRYSDLAFRLFRDDRLQKYSGAFDLAARYVYLAAKAYDYETGLLTSDENLTAGQEFLASIARARSLGLLSRFGAPIIGDGRGDPGLADIMARMKANWSVLDGRFGFNNPQVETSRFSMRTELFRILLESGRIANRTWSDILAAARVPDLNAVPEYNRYCRPFSETGEPEPGIVLRFSTEVMAGQNFFGRPLAGGDNAYSPGHAATKIRSVGVWFYNYDNEFLANQPQVYLVPVGIDKLRSPTDHVTVRNYRVMDQSLPIPYPVTPGEFDHPDWIPIKDTLSAGFTQIRRYATFRAYHENDPDQYINAGSETVDSAEVFNKSRLVGRSVWNTEWLLIIPGRSLLSDPDVGLDRFIEGDGRFRDNNFRGIKDIRIFFHTYAVEGE